MPYATRNDLPESVKSHLPAHAQDIFKEAFNSAFHEYKDPSKRRDPKEDPEEIAFKVAWGAVKEKYKKQGNRWVVKKT